MAARASGNTGPAACTTASYAFDTRSHRLSRSMA